MPCRISVSMYPTYVGRESITMDHGMHDTMMSLLRIHAILVLGLYFTLILVFDKSRVSLYATPLTDSSSLASGELHMPFELKGI